MSYTTKNSIEQAPALQTPAASGDGHTAPASAPASPATPATRRENYLVYLLFGAVLGLLLVKSEAVSWFRIQEMFRFQSFHMYGIIGSAVAVAAASVALIKRFDVRTVYGEPITTKVKSFERGYSQLFGGILFGLGWALLGACPGPIYALIGTGITVMVVALASAVAGAWLYGHLKPHLPH